MPSTGRMVVAGLAVVVLTGCAFTQQSSSPPVPSLVDLSAAAPVAVPIQTVAIPTDTHVSRLIVPPRGLLLTSDNGSPTGGPLVQLLSLNTQQPLWSIPIASDGRRFDAGPSALGLYDKTLGLTRLDYNTGIILSRFPITGDSYVRAGDEGRRLYILPTAGKPWRNYQMILLDHSAELQVIPSEKPFDDFAAARGSDAVLLACPDVRLVSGGRVVWTYPINECPSLELSEDGTIAYLLTPRADDGTQRVIVLRDGKALWEQPLKASTENVLFAARGKRFWLRLHDADGKPFVQLSDPTGAVLGRWALPFNEDNIEAVDPGGTFALVRIGGAGGDIVLLTDRGEVKWHASHGLSEFTLVDDVAHLVYLVDEFARQVRVVSAPGK